jgi:hypothetical protein
VVEHRQSEVAPTPLRRWLVHLQDVLETEETSGSVAVVNQAVKR